MKRAKERETIESEIDKGRGEGRGEHLQALKLLDFLLLSRLSSYPLLPQLLNQQGGSQFEHLIRGSPFA